jgi:hypothetical protein
VSGILFFHGLVPPLRIFSEAATCLNMLTTSLMKEKGIPLEKQKFDWRDIVQVPTSKLDDNALTRVRIILMNGIESEAVRFPEV